MTIKTCQSYALTKLFALTDYLIMCYSATFYAACVTSQLQMTTLEMHVTLKFENAIIDIATSFYSIT